MAYKYKLSEMSKTASADEAEKELGIPKRKFEVGQVTYSDDGTRKSEITAINPETGAVKWTITQLPGFDKLYDDLTDLVSTAKRTYVKTKDDKKFRDFYDEIRVIRNKVRTHLRNEYPDQYKRITRIGEMFSKDILDLDKKIKEDDVDEIENTAAMKYPVKLDDEIIFQRPCPKDRYCICQNRNDSDSYIACIRGDKCVLNGWVHSECVGIPRQAVRRLRNLWVCPVCVLEETKGSS